MKDCLRQRTVTYQIVNLELNIHSDNSCGYAGDFALREMAGAYEVAISLS